MTDEKLLNRARMMADRLGAFVQRWGEEFDKAVDVIVTLPERRIQSRDLNALQRQLRLMVDRIEELTKGKAECPVMETA